MFGINGGELLVLALVAVLVVGPERLPAYAEQLGRGVRSLRAFLRTTRERVAEEMGEEVADVDWSQLDPRRYDPRRIVREALLDDDVPPVTGRRYTTSGAARARAAGGATDVTGTSVAGGAGGAAGLSAATDAAPGAPGSSPTGSGQGGPAPFDDEAT